MYPNLKLKTINKELVMNDMGKKIASPSERITVLITGVIFIFSGALALKPNSPFKENLAILIIMLFGIIFAVSGAVGTRIIPESSKN